MSPQALLSYAAGLGISLSADGDQLRWRAPEGVMTAALKDQLQSRKGALLRLLRQPQSGCAVAVVSEGVKQGKQGPIGEAEPVLEEATETIRCSKHTHTAVEAIEQAIHRARDHSDLRTVYDDIQRAFTIGQIDDAVADGLSTLMYQRSRVVPGNENAAILPMSLDGFGRVGREVRSGVLEERVIFAADNAEVPDDTALVVYQASELQLLDGASPEILKAVHQAKGVFDGEVVEVDSPDDQVIPSEALWGPQACCACGQRKWWRKDSGERICGVCHPQRGR